MGASKCSLEPMKTNSSPQQHHNPRPCDSMRLLLASVLALSSRAHGFLAPGGARVSIHSSNGAGFVKSDVSSVPSLSKGQDGGRARAAGPVSAFGMRSGSKVSSLAVIRLFCERASRSCVCAIIYPPHELDNSAADRSPQLISTLYCIYNIVSMTHHTCNGPCCTEYLVLCWLCQIGSMSFLLRDPTRVPVYGKRKL